MNAEERNEIKELFQQGMPVRAIARKLGRDPKTVRRVLGRRRSDEAPPSKIERFQPVMLELLKKEYAAPRILREVRERGYTGGLSILKDHLRKLRGTLPRAPKVFRRFETAPAQEAQVDWSPFRLPIGGQEAVAHCFSMILAYSRRIWIGFFRNERLPTLLYAHTQALAYHQGAPHRMVYDNQTTVTLGRAKQKPIWHPSFLEFAKYYGFKPFACRPKHKERKGKVERPFSWIFDDFLKGCAFESWQDLNQRAFHWFDTIANLRKHTTTGCLIHERYAEERPLLIELPPTPFPAERREVRRVQKDGYLALDGSYFPVPAHLVGQEVLVRVYPTRIEVLDAAGKVAATHPVPDRPTRIPSPFHPPAPAAPPVTLNVLEAHFLARFPDGGPFLDGLKRRMNALTPIHLRRLERLAALYGEENVASALARAGAYRNYSALAVARILERAHPNVVPEPPVDLLTARPEVMGALDDLESVSLEDCTLDRNPPTDGESHGSER